MHPLHHGSHCRNRSPRDADRRITNSSLKTLDGDGPGLMEVKPRGAKLAFNVRWMSASERQALKILIIEDEPKAAEYLRQGLSESGYAVDVAHNGTEGLHEAA